MITASIVSESSSPFDFKTRQNFDNPETNDLISSTEKSVLTLFYQ